MHEQNIVIEADSLEEAKRALDRDDLIVLETSVLRLDKVKTFKSTADTIEEAILKIRTNIPAEAKVEAQEIKVNPAKVVLEITGFDEESVRQEISSREIGVIASTTLCKKGRRGFWGMFKKPNIYGVEVFRQGVVEIRCREKAILQAKVRGYLAMDLLRIVREIRNSNASWTEILQQLNPRNDSQIQTLLNSFGGADSIEPKTILDFIEDACRKDESMNWEAAIRTAHSKVAEARVKMRVELRGLDAELAGVFMFYTSIDWYPKYHKEPTGIPMVARTSYGRHYPGDQYRQIIPHYSTDMTAFSILEGRAKQFGCFDQSNQILLDEGHDYISATLKQKCSALLEARKIKLRGGK